MLAYSTTEGGAFLNMVNIPIVTTRPFSLPFYLHGSENGRVVTIGKHSRLNRQICAITRNGAAAEIFCARLQSF
jgi:hypothetical protein